MYRRKLLILFASILLFSPYCSYGASDFIITLSNGNQLEANSYSVKNGKVFLRYPVGEAVIPVGDVVSIKAGDGSMELLQSEGKFIPHNAEAKTTLSKARSDADEAALDARKPAQRQWDRRDRQNMPGSPTGGKAADAGQPHINGQSKERASGGGFGTGGDPRIDSLIEQSFYATDEAQQKQIDDALQKLLDAEDNQ